MMIKEIMRNDDSPNTFSSRGQSTAAAAGIRHLPTYLAFTLDSVASDAVGFSLKRMLIFLTPSIRVTGPGAPQDGRWIFHGS